MSPLIDSYGRRFEYLRLSVTDRCNFRCVYCLPNGYQAPKGPVEAELSVDEIRRLVSAFAELGVWKVRLTGGEPTIRRDLVDVARAVSSVRGIRRVALTTNGGRLAELAGSLRTAGVSAVNVSIDSLDKQVFKEVTGTDRLDQVLAGVEEVIRVGFESVKVNAVLLREITSRDVTRFMEWVRHRNVSVRFIELMQTGKNAELFSRRYVSGGEVRLELLRSGWVQEIRARGDGPAVVFRHRDYAGSVGVIAPYSSEFCDSCNRLRVSSRGALRLCLFGEGDESVRDLLQDDTSRERLVDRLTSLVLRKPAAHQLHEGKYGNTWNLSSIGG